MPSPTTPASHTISDASLECLPEPVLPSSSQSTEANAAARVFGITELLEAVLVATVPKASYMHLSPEDLCRYFRVQRVNKTFAPTVAESLPLRKAMFRVSESAKPDNLPCGYEREEVLNPIFFRPYVHSRLQNLAHTSATLCHSSRRVSNQEEPSEEIRRLGPSYTARVLGIDKVHELALYDERRGLPMDAPYQRPSQRGL
ncbi:hypothetical protein LTR95_016873 [Oleoguttula sp. CCFEE 5521]